MIVQINESALRHGVIEEDIHRALATVVFDGSYNVFHAMKCRKEFYHYAEEGAYDV
jgi:hypothetical protein